MIPSFLRLIVAAVLALLVGAFFSAPAFAQGVAFATKATLTSAKLQQVTSPANANMGLVIVGVDAAGPAAHAGIVRGDIVQRADTVPVNSTATFYGVVTTHKVGDQVVLVIRHGDEMRSIPVTLGQRGDRPYLGVEVVDSPAVAVQAPQVLEASPVVPLPSTAGQLVTATVALRLIVADVMDGSPASIAGVAVGDLILAIDGQPVTSPDELINALKGHTPGEVVTLRVQKGGPLGATVDLPVTLGVAPDDLPFMAQWGQFLTWDGQVRKEAVQGFLDCLQEKNRLLEIEECFPFPVLRLECEIDAFYAFYQIERP